MKRPWSRPWSSWCHVMDSTFPSLWWFHASGSQKKIKSRVSFGGYMKCRLWVHPQILAHCGRWHRNPRIFAAPPCSALVLIRLGQMISSHQWKMERSDVPHFWAETGGASMWFGLLSSLLLWLTMSLDRGCSNSLGPRGETRWSRATAHRCQTRSVWEKWTLVCYCAKLRLSLNLIHWCLWVT